MLPATSVAAAAEGLNSGSGSSRWSVSLTGGQGGLVQLDTQRAGHCLRTPGIAWRLSDPLSRPPTPTLHPLSPAHPPSQVLDQRHHGMINGWKWVQANKARFRGPVHGPVAVEVECPDPFHVQCLEQSIGGEWVGSLCLVAVVEHSILRSGVRGGCKAAAEVECSDPSRGAVPGAQQHRWASAAVPSQVASSLA